MAKKKSCKFNLNPAMIDTFKSNLVLTGETMTSQIEVFIRKYNEQFNSKEFTREINGNEEKEY